MPFPIRCFTCGKVVANRYESYLSRVREGENPMQVLTSLGYKRMCCRRMFLTHSDELDERLLLYPVPHNHK